MATHTMSHQQARTLLGVSEDASKKTIQKKFRQFALRYHPDRNPAGEEKFKQYNEAYEILSRPSPKGSKAAKPGQAWQKTSYKQRSQLEELMEKVHNHFQNYQVRLTALRSQIEEADWLYCKNAGYLTGYIRGFFEARSSFMMPEPRKRAYETLCTFFSPETRQDFQRMSRTLMQLQFQIDNMRLSDFQGDCSAQMKMLKIIDDKITQKEQIIIMALDDYAGFKHDAPGSYTYDQKHFH